VAKCFPEGPALSLMVTIPFRIVPKARPRVGQFRTVMPSEYKQSLRDIGWLMVDARNRQCPKWPLDMSYSLSVTVWLPHAAAGDLDNLVGTIMDAGRGLLWKDDRQITEFTDTRKLILPVEPKVALVARTIPRRTGFEAPVFSQSRKV
jgi:Holliday junction resolvase RusA-like endonuclease